MLDWIGDTLTGIVESIIMFLFDSLLGPFLGLDKLEDLIFGRPASMEDETVIWHTFTATDLSEAFVPMYNIMTAIGGALFIIAIVVGGMRISSSGYNPIRRNEIFEFTKELALVGLAFYYLPTLYDVLFTINSGIVGYFDSVISDPASEVNLEDADYGILGTIIIELVMLGLSFWASFYYLMRRVTLLILMSMGPFMITLWMIPQFKGITGAWFKELVGSIFVQSIHAFVYFVIAVISLSQAGISMVGTVILYIIFIPITESIRGLLGLGGGMQGGLAKVGSAFGMSALAGMYGAIKGATKGDSVMGSLRDKKKGKEDGEGKEGEGSNNVDNKTFADTQTNKMLGAGSFVSKLGKATLGAAGSLAGSGLGPMGAIMGAEAGSRIGGVAGGIGGRVGAAAALGIANRLKSGKDAVNDLKDSQGNEDQIMTNAIADMETRNWANNNKESIMNQLREDFPNATPQDLEKKFEAIKAQKLEGFRSQASKTWTSARDIAENAGDGKALVNASADAMSKQWAKDNRESFMKDFEKENPRMNGESVQAYSERKEQAFGQRVSQMKDNFAKDGNDFVEKMGGESGLVSRKALASHMSTTATEHEGVGDIDLDNMNQVATRAMDHVSGATLFEKSGKPNISAIANSIASVKTAEQGRIFVQEAMNNGATQQQAVEMWQSKEKEAFKTNVTRYSSELPQNVTGLVKPLPTNTAQAVMQQAGAFTRGVMNLDGFKNTVNIVKEGFTQGTQTLKLSMSQGNVFTAVPNAISGGIAGAVNRHISQHKGDAVKAQHAFNQSVGYASAVVFGANGLKKAQHITSSIIAPYTKPVEQQISAPSEVIQMAQTIPDDNGIEQIAPGAIRQVITRDASYVEVRTNSGEVRTVSKIGAGNEGLKKGEIVYQDLSSADGVTLATVPLANTKTSFYRVDSGGARIPVNMTNKQDPISLLGNPSHAVHAPVIQKDVPVLNQRVDAGRFYMEDLTKMDMSNLQVVLQKGKRFVTGEKDGITYRVSPIYQGDARLSGNQTVTVPVTISGGRLTPVNQTSSVSVDGQIKTQPQETVKQVITTQNIKLPNQLTSTRNVVQNQVQVLSGPGSMNVHRHYDDTEVAQLIQSKHEERAQRIVQRRQALENIRRRQGFVGF